MSTDVQAPFILSLEPGYPPKRFAFVADLFIFSGGVAWSHTHWPEFADSEFPFHYREGEFEPYNSGWRVAEVKFYPLDPEHPRWRSWLAYLAEIGETQASMRQRTRRLIEAEFHVTL